MPIPVFYVPFLHPDREKTCIPGTVACFSAGLPLRPTQQDDGGTAERQALEQAYQLKELVRKSLPLCPEEARNCLVDMLRMGEEYAAGGLLKELAAAHQMQAKIGRRAPRPGEREALARFAETGESGQGVSITDWSAHSTEAAATLASETEIKRELENCQKVLLLAHSLEERQKELSELEQRYATLEDALRIIFKADDTDTMLADKEPGYSPYSGKHSDAPHSAGQAAQNSSDSTQPLAWRVFVDAVLPFLPAGAVLFTDDATMALDMRDSGMLQPIPEDKAQICFKWPSDLVSGLLYASLPAWRLVGRSGPPPERPWLKREVEVLVARPRMGWTSAIPSVLKSSEFQGRGE